MRGIYMMNKSKVLALAKNVINEWIGVYIDNIEYSGEVATITFAITLPLMSGIVHYCAHTVYCGFNDALEIQSCDELITHTIANIWRK